MGNTSTHGCALGNHILISLSSTSIAAVQPLEVERDQYCVDVLLSRQRDGYLPACPVSRDVVTYIPSGGDLEAELLLAGFPCQASPG